MSRIKLIFFEGSFVLQTCRPNKSRVKIIEKVPVKHFYLGRFLGNFCALCIKFRFGSKPGFRASFLRRFFIWIQEGFTAEPPRNDSGANFQWNDSDSGPKVRITGRKPELRTKSRRYSRANPQNPNRIAQKRAPQELRPQGSGRGPENGNFPKVVKRGCKRCLGPRVPKSSCTGAKKGCTGAKQGRGGAKDSWETLPLLPGSKTPFAPSPNHFWEISIFGPSSQRKKCSAVCLLQGYPRVTIRTATCRSLEPPGPKSPKS